MTRLPKAATFRSVGRNSSDNLRADVDMRLSLSNSSMKRWFTPRADSRWLRVSSAARNLPCAAHPSVSRAARHDPGALTWKLASASSCRLVSGFGVQDITSAKCRKYRTPSPTLPYVPLDGKKTLVTVRSWIVTISILNTRAAAIQLRLVRPSFPDIAYFSRYMMHSHVFHIMYLPCMQHDKFYKTVLAKKSVFLRKGIFSIDIQKRNFVTRVSVGDL